jgi:hypothetical protein
MLVGTHDGAVEKGVLNVRITSKLGKHCVPHLCSGPSGEAFVLTVPRSEIVR